MIVCLWYLGCTYAGAFRWLESHNCDSVRAELILFTYFPPYFNKVASCFILIFYFW